MKKAIIYIVAFVVLATPFLVASEAEENTIILTNYTIEIGWFEGEPSLLINYIWRGEKHSFAWDELWIEPQRPIWIKLTPEGHCYDADYCTTIEELP